ncbi:MAG: lipoate--protein ligase family protein [Planctomycetota bacterium]|nr:MAG: lipoate--protein ligase family protein [Planctomycetota bacterium]
MITLYNQGGADGPTNMARDEALLHAATGVALRLYTWSPPCLSLGLFQNAATVRQTAPSGVTMVRRITGGGTIYHIHEVTYALVAGLGEHGMPQRLRDCYSLLHGAIMKALLRHGGASLALQDSTVGDRRYEQEPRCFASPAAGDIIHPQGGKTLGSAGRNRQGRFLIHGSLKLASNPWDGDAVQGCGCNQEQAQQALIDGIAQLMGLTVQDCPWPDHLETLSASIREQRYGDAGWVERREGPRP